MNFLQQYYQNFKEPKGILGRYAVYRMNGKRHAALAMWALEGAPIPSNAMIADIGCGGGANIARLLNQYPDSRVTGVDQAAISVNKAIRVNKRAIRAGRCRIVGGNAKLLPIVKETIDVVTAFETVYYWQSFSECVDEIFRVLKPGGACIIANETDGIAPEGAKWAKLIHHMHIYTTQELEQYLAAAGFTNITSRHDPDRHFISVTAHKP